MDDSHCIRESGKNHRFRQNYSEAVPLSYRVILIGARRVTNHNLDTSFCYREKTPYLCLRLRSWSSVDPGCTWDVQIFFFKQLNVVDWWAGIFRDTEARYLILSYLKNREDEMASGLPAPHRQLRSDRLGTCGQAKRVGKNTLSILGLSVSTSPLPEVLQCHQESWLALGDVDSLLKSAHSTYPNFSTCNGTESYLRMPFSFVTEFTCGPTLSNSFPICQSREIWLRGIQGF